MESFQKKLENGFLSIKINRLFGFTESTSPFGGYDTESIIEIKCSNYYVKGLLLLRVRTDKSNERYTNPIGYSMGSQMYLN